MLPPLLLRCLTQQRDAMAVSYGKAGVSIERGDRLAEAAKRAARATLRPEIVTGVGGFGALFRIPRRYKRPLIVSSTDGVGTKLRIALQMKRHDTVGIDLVAMSVNDMLTLGAEPIAFLDYYVTEKLDTRVAAAVVKGIAKGCALAGCSLIGGETAEHPGCFMPGEYDLAGFAVGVVEEKEVVDGRRIRAGDVLIGLPSNGLHSNGYSLVRHICFDIAKLGLDARLPELRGTLGAELLRPTRIYVSTVLGLPLAQVSGMAHITGGGLPSKLGRIIPANCVAQVSFGSWPVPPVFNALQRLGQVAQVEMLRAFNMGIGYVLVVPARAADKILAALARRREKAYVIGSVRRASKTDKDRVVIRTGE